MCSLVTHTVQINPSTHIYFISDKIGVRVFTGSGLITGSDRIGPDRARNWPIPLLN